MAKVYDRISTSEVDERRFQACWAKKMGCIMGNGSIFAGTNTNLSVVAVVVAQKVAVEVLFAYPGAEYVFECACCV